VDILTALSPKLVPPTNLGKWEQLEQFGSRFVAEARALNAASIVFVEPRRYNSWSYGDAEARVSLQVAATLALVRESIDVRTIAQRTVAKGLGFKKLSSMDAGLPARLGIDVDAVVHWQHRAIAIAAAVHAARELWAQ
jgi:hypothetical protein